jgi:hypothetical protein
MPVTKLIFLPALRAMILTTLSLFTACTLPVGDQHAVNKHGFRLRVMPVGRNIGGADHDRIQARLALLW